MDIKIAHKDQFKRSIASYLQGFSHFFKRFVNSEKDKELFFYLNTENEIKFYDLSSLTTSKKLKFIPTFYGHFPQIFI